MSYLFTSESVSEGHPDKIADQISDALLDEFLRHDPESKVACETLVTTGLVVCSGEVRTRSYIDIQKVVRRTIKNIGYTNGAYFFESNSCGIISTIHEQSPDIRRGVEKANKEDQGAGDQGMMFGYATNEMNNYMPLTIEVAHVLLQKLAEIRHHKLGMDYLRPDSKSQVTVEYDDQGVARRIDTIVISTQHDPFSDEKTMRSTIENDIRRLLIPMVMEEPTLPARVRQMFRDDFRLLVNPTGVFVIGGPHGDTGLTGRKIIVDTYGGHGAHGGGAFSGKDASKVDRSAAYAMRHIAKNMVAAGLADQVLVQVAYAIGVAQPVGLYVNTYGTSRAKHASGRPMNDGEIARIILDMFDLRPYSIIERFGLKKPVYLKTATYGHFGRDPYTASIPVCYNPATLQLLGNGNCPCYGDENEGDETRLAQLPAIEAEFFAWEKLDRVEDIRSVFRL